MRRLILAAAFTLAASPALAETAVVYKSPTCGCCTGYADALRDAGYDVQEKNMQRMGTVKQMFGIEREHASCHTTVIGDRVVEGHVPLDVLEAYLADSDAPRGIALPGMPTGVPGMPGPKQRLHIVDLDGETYTTR